MQGDSQAAAEHRHTARGDAVICSQLSRRKQFSRRTFHSSTHSLKVCLVKRRMNCSPDSDTPWRCTVPEPRWTYDRDRDIGRLRPLLSIQAQFRTTRYDGSQDRTAGVAIEPCCVHELLLTEADLLPICDRNSSKMVKGFVRPDRLFQRSGSSQFRLPVVLRFPPHQDSDRPVAPDAIRLKP